jgi:hypothetical protein
MHVAHVQCGDEGVTRDRTMRTSFFKVQAYRERGLRDLKVPSLYPSVPAAPSDEVGGVCLCSLFIGSFLHLLHLDITYAGTCVGRCVGTLLRLRNFS